MAEIASLQNSGLLQCRRNGFIQLGLALQVLLVIELMLLCVVMTVGDERKLPLL